LEATAYDFVYQGRYKGDNMVRLDGKKNKLLIDLKHPTGQQLAEMILQAVFLYGAETDQDRAILRQMARMVKGEEPKANIDLKDYLKGSK
jgi:hypothetical protein